MQTESVGALSLISYLLRLYKFYKIALPKDKTVHYCNNIIAINRIQYSQRRNGGYPNKTLRVGYNIQAQIQETIQQLKVKQQTEWESLHMKQHQTRPNLTKEAELNNIADELVTGARKEIPWSKRYKEPPLYPASKVAVIIDNKMITQKIEKEIIQVATAGELRLTIENKFK